MRGFLAGVCAILAGLALPCPAAHAGDRLEHRELLYALALRAGKTPADARIIADAAWSLDTQKPTTAFQGWKDIPLALRDLAKTELKFINPAQGVGILDRNNPAQLDQLLMPSGELYRLSISAAYHAMYVDPAAAPDGRNSPSLDPIYRRWTAAQLERLGEQDRHVAKLVMEAQYYHQLYDSLVHPTNEIKGHAEKFHYPDYAINDPKRHARAAEAVLEAMVSNPDYRSLDKSQLKQFGLDTAAKRQAIAQTLIDAVNKGYDPKYDPKNPEASKTVWNLWDRSVGEIPGAVERGQKEVQSALNKLLKDAGMETAKLENWKEITFKADGDNLVVTVPGAKPFTVENLVSYILTQPENKVVADAIRDQARDFLRLLNPDVALLEAMNELMRKKAPVETSEDRLRTMRELLRVQEEQRIRKMTPEEKLAELSRLLLKPEPEGGKKKPSLLELARNLPPDQKQPIIKDPATAKPGPSKPELKPAAPPPAIGSPSVVTPPAVNPPAAKPRPESPPPTKPQPKEKKEQGPFTVNYYRVGDYPQGGELEGIFSTREKALQAAESIRKWAAEIAANSPNSVWRIEKVEIIDEATGKKQVVTLTAGGQNRPAVADAPRERPANTGSTRPRSGFPLTNFSRSQVPQQPQPVVQAPPARVGQSPPVSNQPRETKTLVVNETPKGGNPSPFRDTSVGKKDNQADPFPSIGRGNPNPAPRKPADTGGRYSWLMGDKSGKLSPAEMESIRKNPQAYTQDKDGKWYYEPSRKTQAGADPALGKPRFNTSQPYPDGKNTKREYDPAGNALDGKKRPPPDGTGISGTKRPPPDGTGISGTKRPPPDGTGISGTKRPPPDGTGISGTKRPPPDGTGISGTKRPPPDGTGISGTKRPPPDGTGISGTKRPPPDGTGISGTKRPPPDGTGISGTKRPPAPESPKNPPAQPSTTFNPDRSTNPGPAAAPPSPLANPKGVRMRLDLDPKNFKKAETPSNLKQKIFEDK